MEVQALSEADTPKWCQTQDTVSFSPISLLGCTPQAYTPCACPASRPKKEPGAGNRDISGLTDGGAYMSEARSWRDTVPCAGARRAGCGRTWRQSLLGERDCQLYGD